MTKTTYTRLSDHHITAKLSKPTPENGERYYPLSRTDAPELCEGLTDNLIHIIVTVGRKPPHEVNIRFVEGQLLVPLE